VLFALPMDDEALAIYRACTGRSMAPAVPFHGSGSLCWQARRQKPGFGFDRRLFGGVPRLPAAPCAW
jgi:hypothetical protein